MSSPLDPSRPTTCDEAITILERGARELGVALDAGARTQFIRYCGAISGAPLNVTAIRSPDRIMSVLFLDSLTLIPVLEEMLGRADWSLADVGSGAGIPGIPLRIALPGTRVTLFESVAKKAKFAQSTALELGLDNIRVNPERAESAGRLTDYRDMFDVCIARAVSPLPSLLELCAPFVRQGGVLAFPKGGNIDQELYSAREAARVLHAAEETCHRVPILAGLGADKVIVTYRKSAPTPPAFPRRIGLAQSRPIGVKPVTSAPTRARGERR